MKTNNQYSPLTGSAFTGFWKSHNDRYAVSNTVVHTQGKKEKQNKNPQSLGYVKSRNVKQTRTYKR